MKQLPKYAKIAMANGNDFVSSLNNPNRKLTDGLRMFKVTKRLNVLGSDVITVNELSDAFSEAVIATYEFDTDLMH
jgi:hypothetical protein